MQLTKHLADTLREAIKVAKASKSDSILLCSGFTNNCDIPNEERRQLAELAELAHKYKVIIDLGFDQLYPRISSYNRGAALAGFTIAKSTLELSTSELTTS